MEESGVTRKEFDELRDLVKENNLFLHNMRKWGRIAFWSKVVIWTLVLGVPLLLLSYFAPFLNVLPGASGTSATGTSLFGLPSPTELQQILHPSTTTKP